MANEPLILNVDADQAERWFGNLLRRSADLSGLMAQIGEDLTESTQTRFDTGVGPDGVAWEALADGSGRTPLNATHRTRDGIHPLSGIDWVEIRADSKQARWHQEGTSPYVIKPKDKKALAWPGGPGPRGAVKHPGLPARPFIGISAEDSDGIERLSVAWLDLGSDPSDLVGA